MKRMLNSIRSMLHRTCPGGETGRRTGLKTRFKPVAATCEELLEVVSRCIKSAVPEPLHQPIQAETERHSLQFSLQLGALLAPSAALPVFPVKEIFGLLRIVAIVGGLLWIVVIPAVLTSYENWKRKERVR